MATRLLLISPPAIKGRTNERSQSGGLGVSRKLKPLEKETIEVPSHDFLLQASVAEQAGHTVRIVDLVLERVMDHRRGLEHVRRALAVPAAQPANESVWIGVRLSITSLNSDLRFANDVKAAFPMARVYGFGSVIMATYRHWVSEAKFDYLFYGEPESIVQEAMRAGDPASVEGVVDVQNYVPVAEPDVFDESSVALFANWRKVSDLNALPQAAWHLIELYRYAPRGDIKQVGVNVEASRGCFMPCTMCPYNLIEGRGMRFRTPESVVDEIVYLHRTFGIHHMSFRDPNFAANKPQVRAICHLLIELALPIDFAAELSLELLDRELLTLMHRAGIRTILTGIESDVPEIMRTLGQNTKINRILEEKVPLCDELGIHVYGFFLIGSPEETWHTVKRTWTFARSLGIEATMTILTPFPGTPIYWRAQRENLLANGRQMTYEEWNSYTATMRTYTMSLREVKLARTWARLETYLPYRRRRLKGAPLRGSVRGLLHLAPRAAALGALRLYAAWKLRSEGSETSTPSPAPIPRSTNTRLFSDDESIPLAVRTIRSDDKAPVGTATGGVDGTGL
jgi:radical SAM superfamily enzyme YgiQ (UPF0313 family)